MARWILTTVALLSLLAGCAATDTHVGNAAPNANTPGFTGRTVVPGNGSTIAGDAGATEQQQKWPLQRGR